MVFYNNSCPTALYASLQRQVLATPTPSKQFEHRFTTWFQIRMLPYLKQHLSDFEYSIPHWYNHLKASTQNRVLPFMQEYKSTLVPFTQEQLTDRKVTIFCKAEKQAEENGEPPKNRAISAINSADIWVMGPVVFFLNMHFKKIIPGFSSGENWTKQAKIYDKWKNKNFKVLQSDISGWDRSIQKALKESLFAVYELISPFVKHVPIDIFLEHATAITTFITADFFIKGGGVDKVGSAKCDYQIFSGTSDTKDGNTYINSVLTTFLLEEYFSINILDNIDPELEDPMENCDAGLRAAGDDNITALPDRITLEEIQKVYREVFCKSDIIKSPYLVNNVTHGSGLTLKYLLYSNTDMIDFCSTSTFYCNTCNEHRITRKLDRFIQFMPWTAKGIDNTKIKLSSYKYQLHIANLMWMDGLPIFSAYNDLLNTGDTTQIANNGKPKDEITLTKEDYNIAILKKTLDPEYNRIFTHMEQTFGREEAFTMATRQTRYKPCCVHEFENTLFERCGLTINDIQEIHQDIKSGVGQFDFSSIKLTMALHHMQAHIDQHRVEL
jgi:hypothetical protein